MATLPRSGTAAGDAAPQVLVVDDDPKIVATMVRYLESAGFGALTAADGLEALRVARAHQPALVILDRMLPLLDGASVCRLLREESTIPIIMLTARSTEHDRLEGLDLGADDYIVKPFSPREVIARVRAVLRRLAAGAATLEPEVLTVGRLHIDVSAHETRIDDAAVDLTPTEFRLLTVLARAPGRVFPRATLVDKLFGWDYEGAERGIDAHIKNLRRKIEPDRHHPTLVLTVFGVGYRLARPD